MPKKHTLSAYDSADYLDSDEAIHAYLEEAIATGDPIFITAALKKIANLFAQQHTAI